MQCDIISHRKSMNREGILHVTSEAGDVVPVIFIETVNSIARPAREPT